MVIAAVARKPHSDFSIEDIELGAMRPDEVRVKILGVGVCHTDLVIRDQFMPYPLPAVLGHEGAGIVEAVGSDVVDLVPGDHVVLGFAHCGACPRCDRGLPSYCLSFGALNYAGKRLDDGSTAFSKDGENLSSHFFGQSSFSSSTIVAARNAVKVDASLPIALLGPLGCGFQTGAGSVMRSLACTPGSSIAIFGGGPVGLAAVMAAVIRGCSTIILVDPLESRRDAARDMGATHVIDPVSTDLGEALSAIAADGLDYVLDTTGNEQVVQTALAHLGNHGAMGLVGIPKSGEAAISVNIASLLVSGQRIMGIIEGDSDPQSFIPELLDHFKAGRFPFDRLIKTFPLAEINEAIAVQARGDCVKAVLIP